MAIRKELQNLLDSLQLSNEESWRGDCVVCGNKNTLSVTKEVGRYKYYCFHASCEISGEEKGRLDVGDITHYLSLDRSKLGNDSMGATPYICPDSFVLCNDRDAIRLYASKFPSAKLLEKLDLIRYDVKQNRIVFLIQHDGVTYGAAGRALDFRVKPKWFIYHNDSSAPFRVTMGALDRKQTNSAIVVEDCISACAASNICDSFALLGTNVPEDYVAYFRKYDSVILALDKDASKKALKLQKELSPYVDCKIKFLEEDLKYLKEEEIRKCLRL
jgi:hypothetical protein